MHLQKRRDVRGMTSDISLALHALIALVQTCLPLHLGEKFGSLRLRAAPFVRSPSRLLAGWFAVVVHLPNAVLPAQVLGGLRPGEGLLHPRARAYVRARAARLLLR